MNAFAPNPSPPIRLLLVDDHQVTRLGLRTVLGRFPQVEVVGEAGTASAAVAETIRCQPKVVLLDVRLPDGSGVEACRQIQKLELDIRVLFLTSFGDDETVFNAIAAGADGFLLKEIDWETLLRAIMEVAAGRCVIDPAVTRRVLSRLRSPLDIEKKTRLQLLSGQERRVLALVAAGKTNREIGQNLGLSEKTVKNYFSHTLGKLQMSRRSQAAAFYVQHAAASG